MQRERTVDGHVYVCLAKNELIIGGNKMQMDIEMTANQT